MASYYIIHDEGDFISADGTKRFLKLSGKQAYDYLNSPEGQGKRFMRINSPEDDEQKEDEYVEVPHLSAKEYRKNERREQYIHDCKEESGIVTVSLDTIEEDLANDSVSGEEVIADAVDVEEQVMHTIDLEILRKALQSLSAEERYIIDALFLAERVFTEEELAQRLHVSQQAVNRKKLRILRKLKKYFL